MKSHGYELNKIEIENANAYADTFEKLYLYTIFQQELYRRFANLICSFIPDKQSTILEWGCGTGHLLNALAELGYSNLYGLDLSPKMVRRAGHFHNNISALQCDGKYIAMPSNSCDVICAFASLHHVPNLLPVIQEFNRCLKKDAILIIGEPNIDIFQRYPILGLPFAVVNKILRRFGLTSSDPVGVESPGVTPHHRFLTGNELQTLLEQHHLKIVHYQEPYLISYGFNVVNLRPMMNLAFNFDSILSRFVKGGFVIHIVARNQCPQ